MAEQKVSIVIPVRNGGRFIAKALDSVVSQLPNGWDVVVVNDHSSDGTADIAARYEGVRLIDASSEGVTAARLDGANLSSARFLFFMDADDTVPHGSLAALDAALAAHGDCHIIFGDFYEGEESSMELSPYAPEIDGSGRELFDWIVTHRRGFLWGKLISRKLFLSIQLMPFGLKFCEDYTQMLQIAYMAVKVKHISTPVYCYLRHESSVCNSLKSRRDYADMFLDLARALHQLIDIDMYDEQAALRLRVMYLYYMRLYLWVSGSWRGVDCNLKSNYSVWAKEKALLGDPNFTRLRRREAIITGIVPWLPAALYVPLLKYKYRRIK